MPRQRPTRYTLPILLNIRNVEGGFYYLSLLTDGYSRKIVSWALEDSLEMLGPIKALKMALEALPEGNNLSIILTEECSIAAKTTPLYCVGTNV